MAVPNIEPVIDQAFDSFVERLDERLENDQISRSEYHQQMAEVEKRREKLQEQYGGFSEDLSGAIDTLSEEILEEDDPEIELGFGQEKEPRETGQETGEKTEEKAEPEEPQEEVEEETLGNDEEDDIVNEELEGELEEVEDIEDEEDKDVRGEDTKYTTGGALSDNNGYPGYEDEDLFVAAATDQVKWEVDELFYNRRKEMLAARKEVTEDGKLKVSKEELNRIEKQVTGLKPQHIKGTVRGLGDRGDFFVHPLNIHKQVFAADDTGEVEVGDRVYLDIEPEELNAKVMSDAEIVDVYDPVSDYRAPRLFDNSGFEKLDLSSSVGDSLSSKWVKVRETGCEELHPELVYLAHRMNALRFDKDEIFYEPEREGNPENLDDASENLKRRDIVSGGSLSFSQNEEIERVIWNLTDNYMPPA